MREHAECEAAIYDALAHGRDGKAEWYATRCDLAHGHLESAGTERVAPVRAALAERTDTEEVADA